MVLNRMKTYIFHPGLDYSERDNLLCWPRKRPGCGFLLIQFHH